jgi:hypothetical protein
MKTWSESLKPRASSRIQILLAALMWTVVGGGLLFFGTRWITGPGRSLPALGLILAGVVIGVAKSKFVLDRTARKIVLRIGERGEGRCAGGFLSLRSWLLVLGMIVLGRFLRQGLLPATAAGLLYTAVGTGLLFSSRLAWRAWLGR